MLQVIGIALATLICYIFLREKAPQFAVIITVCGVCIILAITVVQFKSLSTSIDEIITDIPSSASYIKLMIKALIIMILTQITSDICRDNGEASISSVVEISAKIIVISMVLPLFKTILTLVLGLIK